MPTASCEPNVRAALPAAGRVGCVGRRRVRHRLVRARGHAVGDPADDRRLPGARRLPRRARGADVGVRHPPRALATRVRGVAAGRPDRHRARLDRLGLRRPRARHTGAAARRAAAAIDARRRRGAAASAARRRRAARPCRRTWRGAWSSPTSTPSRTSTTPTMPSTSSRPSATRWRRAAGASIRWVARPACACSGTTWSTSPRRSTTTASTPRCGRPRWTATASRSACTLSRDGVRILHAASRWACTAGELPAELRAAVSALSA